MKKTDEKKERIAFIINPISGNGNKDKDNVLRLIDSYIDLKRFKCIIKYTKAQGDAMRIAQKQVKKGAVKIIAVGGDGTVNEVASELTDTPVALGIIPMGSGNGLARHLHIPMNVKKAVKLINSNKITQIDYGMVNNKKFFCTCGVGFDALVGNKFSESHRRGFNTYIKTTIQEFFRYRPSKYILKFNSTKIKTRAFLITFANAAQYGNNAYISPDADIQDGLLDICIMSPFPKIIAIDLGLKLFNKDINKSKFVDVMRAKEILLKRKHSGEVHYDGEPCIMGKELNLKVVHKGLNVIIP